MQVIDFSETRCAPCGTLAGPAFDSLLDYEGDLLTAIKIYRSSTPVGMNATIASAWGLDFTATIIPNFFVNNQFQAISLSVNATVQSVLQKAQLFAAAPVVASVALSRQFNADSIIVNTLTHFYKDTVGIYKLGIYVIESPVYAPQLIDSGPPVPGYAHYNLLRESNSTDYNGVPLNNGTPVHKGDEIRHRFSIAINPDWNRNNLKVIAVIWKKEINSRVINTKVLK